MHFAANQDWMLFALILIANTALALWWLTYVKLWRLLEELEEHGRFMLPHFGDTIIRLVYLALFITNMPFLCLPPIEPIRFAQPLSFAILAAALYLAACKPGTPRPRRVMRWAEA